MPITFFAQNFTRTIQPNAYVTGVALSGGLIQITAANNFVAGDIVQIAGIAGPTEANGQGIVSAAGLSTAAFSLVNTVGTGTAYVSGGIVQHLGWSSPAVLVDNTIFPNVPANFNLQTRVGGISPGSTVRFCYEDSADANFLTAESVATRTGNKPGTVAPPQTVDPQGDVLDMVKIYDMPDVRYGQAGNNLRLKVFISGGTWSSATFSAFLDY